MKLLISSLLAGILIFTGSCSPRQTIAGSSSASARDLLQAVNNIRAKGCTCSGTHMPPVKALQWNDKLEAAAQGHSDYMNRNKILNHTGSKRSTPASRISTAGYKWVFVAENIAMGQHTVKEVMQSWLNSPGHCKNIMSKNAVDMGAAKSGAYWTLVFAAPL